MLKIHNASQFLDGLPAFAVENGSQPIISHHKNGTVYGERAAEVYSHGPDGFVLLNPVLGSIFDRYVREGDRVIDLGCGSANEAMNIAKFGAQVIGIDFQASMIEEGERKVEAAGLSDRIELLTGDASDLSMYPEIKDMDLALSVLVGCNLPDGVFQSYFTEMSRVIKAKAVVVLPSSLDVVFTNGTSGEEEALKHIGEVLHELPLFPKPEEIELVLKKLSEVNSATFYVKDGRLTLVTNINELQSGEQIWRKLPNGLVIPNFYWSEESYSEAFSASSLKVTQVIAPTLHPDAVREAYNGIVTPEKQLGASYTTHPIFKTLILEKKS